MKKVQFVIGVDSVGQPLVYTIFIDGVPPLPRPELKK